MKKLSRRLIGFSILLIIISVACAGIENSKTSKIEKIETFMEAYMYQGKFNGSVLVSNKGEELFKKGYGFANLEWHIPNSTITKFRLASVTKQFTALLVMQMVEEGKIDLNKPVSSYLSDYPKPNADLITIHHLLTHTAAIPYLDRNIREKADVKTLVSQFASLELDREPGELFRYSNEGYILLGYIMEVLSGKSFNELIQEKIFTPLGMENSGIDNYYDIVPLRASGYSKRGDKLFNAPYIDMSGAFSAGYLYSTVEDLFLWDEALRSNTLISEESFLQMIKPHVETGYRHYGYGFQTGLHRAGASDLEIQAHWHTGGVEGFRTEIIRIKESNTCIILLSNSEYAFLPEIVTGILGILNDVPFKFPSQSIGEALKNKIELEGLNAGLSYYDSIRNSSSFYHNEKDLIMAGYHFLQQEKTQEAAEIFKITVNAVPLSSNAYDSYGEALLKLNKRKEAIANYKKSLELDPKNENAVIVLKDLDIDVSELIHEIANEDLKKYVGIYLHEESPEEKTKIEITLKNGVLIYQDNRFNYPLFPVSDEIFVHQARGAELEFSKLNSTQIKLIANGVSGYIQQ